MDGKGSLSLSAFRGCVLTHEDKKVTNCYQRFWRICWGQIPLNCVYTWDEGSLMKLPRLILAESLFYLTKEAAVP